LNQLEKKTLDLGLGRVNSHRPGPPSVATAWDACFTVHRTSGDQPSLGYHEPTEVHGANRVNGCLGYTTEKITWNPKMKLWKIFSFSQTLTVDLLKVIFGFL